MCFSKQPRGIEKWLAQHCKHQTVLPHQYPTENQFCFQRVFILAFVSFSHRSIFSTFHRPSAIAQSLLFDLAPFKSEAWRFPLIYTAIWHNKHRSVCLCICVSEGRRCVLVCVCEARVSEGCVDFGVRLVWEDQSGSLPLSSILQSEREKVRGYFTSYFTEAQGLCIKHYSETVCFIHTLFRFTSAVWSCPGLLKQQLWTRTSLFCH